MAVSFDRELNDLDRGITALRIEYERFFGGELRRPPVVGRRTLEDTLRKLGNAEMEKAAERFRLQTLQSRYNAFAELWDKRMQAREEGRTGPIHRVVHVASPRRVDLRSRCRIGRKGRSEEASAFRGPRRRGPPCRGENERSAGAPPRRPSPLAPTPQPPPP